ncbi:hypothetical protein UFOVP1464_23 [uncultured Caudovirales phage]|uniref:Uncharacterized protein n=1 Tax=uncultured Caudovirales phage TaxID=2100421 RepID=A0A6J5QM16_9CAUD|nr:hypothetical protein UFOVP1103_50 [uncultured Caudovirales phage]CAB4214183.1 hypothetical protein UFOVP1464_23 [uncultured Caudovirales phage]CAB5229406.1 hypothetical protein UFOVP1553_39 [uncultured Caudovirales phage]
MSSISVAGDTSGSISITAPLVAGSSVLTLPVATDTLIGRATTDTLTNKTLTAPVISGSVTGTYTLAGTPTAGASLITSGTAVATTSGTFKDFTSIPSWVKRITVMFNEVSTNGTSNKLVQIGAGSVATSGYVSTGIGQSSAGAGAASSTAGFLIYADSASALVSGIMTIVQQNGTNWVATYSGKFTTTQLTYGGGSCALGGTLDRVRITTVNGTDTFDAGSINILYE